MIITVLNVEGNSTKKGAKQNKTYTVVSQSEKFFDCVDEKGKEFTIWNVNGDWSKIGIRRTDNFRMSYTSNFVVRIL